MKVKTILLFATFLFISSIAQGQDTLQPKASASDTEFKTVLITIDGMACQEGCADTINTNLKNTQGVSSVFTSFETGAATVQYNPDFVSIDDLKLVITNTRVKDYIYTIKNVTIKEILE